MLVNVANWDRRQALVERAPRSLIREIKIMSVRKGDTDGAQKPTRKQDKLGRLGNAAFRGYLNLNLSDQQKERYPAWATSAAYWEALEGFVEAGVHISLKIETRPSGFLASGTQRDPESPNAGLCVTARGKDASTALGRLLYCLTILNQRERWEDIQPLANPDRW